MIIRPELLLISDGFLPSSVKGKVSFSINSSFLLGLQIQTQDGFLAGGSFQGAGLSLSPGSQLSELCLEHTWAASVHSCFCLLLSRHWHMLGKSDKTQCICHPSKHAILFHFSLPLPFSPCMLLSVIPLACRLSGEMLKPLARWLGAQMHLAHNGDGWILFLLTIAFYLQFKLWVFSGYATILCAHPWGRVCLM